MQERLKDAEDLRGQQEEKPISIAHNFQKKAVGLVTGRVVSERVF